MRTCDASLMEWSPARTHVRAAQAGTIAANEASDLQSRTRLDLAGASVENGGGRMADQLGRA